MRRELLKNIRNKWIQIDYTRGLLRNKIKWDSCCRSNVSIYQKIDRDLALQLRILLKDLKEFYLKSKINTNVNKVMFYKNLTQYTPCLIYQDSDYQNH